MTHYIKRYILSAASTAAAFVTAAAMIFASLPAFAESPNSAGAYWIGANNGFGAFMSIEDFSGAAYDYLSIVSKFTGDNYNYVRGKPKELFSELLSGSIDIIPCVTEKEFEIYGSAASGGKAEDSFMLTKQPIMPKFNAIYVKSDADVRYGNVNEISKLKIGYLSEERSNYFDGNTFLYPGFEGTRFRAFYNEEQLYESFRTGVIDAAVKNSFRAWDDEKIVLRDDTELTYFAVRACDKELAEKLDSAAANVNTQYSNFSSELYNKYVLKNGDQINACSEQAAEYIKSHGEITIGFNLESEMMNYYDSASGKLNGLSGYLMDMLFKNIGISYSVVAYPDRSSCINALKSGNVDLIYGGISSLDPPQEEGLSSTYPLLRQPIALVGLPGAEETESPAIAVVGENEEIRHCVQTYYPSSVITMLASDADAVKALKNNKFDFICTGCYTALELQSSKAPDIRIIKVLSAYSNEAFGYRSGEDALREAVEYGLSSLGGSTIFGKNDFVYYSETLNQKISHNDWRNLTLIVCIVVLILLSVLLVVVTKSRNRFEDDMITGGPAKQKFFTDSQKMLKKADPSKWVAAVFDIDKFKFINEHLGYDEGDNMLRRVYRAVKNNLQPDEVCARTSNDNFALILHNTGNKDIKKRLNKIFGDFESVNSKHVTYPVLFSAGVCCLDLCTGKYNIVNLNFAIDRCNIAKKSIKNLHTNEIAFYDGEIRKKALREKDYENAMPQALADGEFMCYLQPKYGSKSRHIEGAEALIRWQSKEYGFVYPDQFIPIAEKNGFVVELDFFILEEVCKAMRRWINDGLTPIVISVNQSRRHLTHEDYIFRLREIVDRYEIPYEYIELELTESVFTDDAELMLKIMQKLHDIGFKLSIDDFGSGYSSLNMLKDIPADVLKIDREFFSGTVNSQKGRKVISTVVDLTKDLDMQVIAEGVETLDQVEFLEDIECQLIQGYYFSKPIPLPDFERLWAIDRNK